MTARRKYAVMAFKHKISKADPSFLIQNKEFCGQNKKIEAFF